MSATTTTFVDLTDAQMLDYAADPDFSMHAMGSSPDWLTVEATMSDDTNTIPDATLHDYPETIEVDMEPHAEDEEMTEYEMADQQPGDQHPLGSTEDTELVDVDVAEPSQATTPIPITSLPSPVSAPDIFVQQPPAISDTSEHATATTEVPSENAVNSDPGVRGTGATDSSPDFQHMQAQSPLLHPSIGHTELAETHAALDASNDAGATDVAPAAAEESTMSASAQDVEEAQGDEGFAVSAIVANGDETTTRELAEAPIVPQNQTPVPEGGAQHESVQYEEGDDHEAVIAEDHSEAHLSNGEDPHEISDGVYIDPPPAVLLSVVLSSGEQECCLFNQPHASPSQSPNEYASSSTSAEPILLLHQRPTLYYEPLSNVFDALRQEEAIYNVRDLSDGELVLEAYDLDLKITEDNVYAREVTIHELNILHDGIDLRGPLRLRLSSSSPRFITRYQALRDQVAQLTLGLSGGVPAYETGDADDHKAEELDEYEPGQDEPTAYESLPQHEIPDQQYYGEPVEEETAAAEEPDHQQFANPENPETVEDVEDHSAQGGSSLEESGIIEAAEEDVGEEAATANEVQEEYGTELTAEEVPEPLDADEVHRSADAEGSDNTDYAQEVADDDGHFGEDDLSEEYGGEESQYYDADDREAAEQDVVGDAKPAVPTTAPEDEVEESEVTYDEPHDSSLLSQSETGEDGEVVDNATREDGAEPEVNANYETNPDSAELEELDDYDELDEVEPLGRVEASHNDKWEDIDDVDNPIESSKDNPENDDALSKYSSETLSSTRSKRSREEDDEFEGLYDSPPETPESKRARVQ